MENFYSGSFIAKWWKRLAVETYTIYCRPLSSHGTWDGAEPFGPSQNISYTGPIAVLTRATIRFSKLNRFWPNVDKVAKLMNKSPGFVLSFGVGEAPYYRQATFSVWRGLEDVKTFAYRSEEHKEVIRKTREENWYSEELFARFEPYRSMGTIHGKDPLGELLISINESIS